MDAGGRKSIALFLLIALQAFCVVFFGFDFVPDLDGETLVTTSILGGAVWA